VRTKNGALVRIYGGQLRTYGKTSGNSTFSPHPLHDIPLKTAPSLKALTSLRRSGVNTQGACVILQIHSKALTKSRPLVSALREEVSTFAETREFSGFVPQPVPPVFWELAERRQLSR
jgi:hypothetical protein